MSLVTFMHWPTQEEFQKLNPTLTTTYLLSSLVPAALDLQVPAVSAESKVNVTTRLCTGASMRLVN